MDVPKNAPPAKESAHNVTNHEVNTVIQNSQPETTKSSPGLLRYTLFTSARPSCLTKKISLDADGGLIKTASAHMSEGHQQLITVENLAVFGQRLKSLQPNQALAYGVFDQPASRVLSQESWIAQDRPADAVTRTTAMMKYPAGPGIMVLDYDPPDDGQVLAPEKLIEKLFDVIPGLKGAEMLQWKSAGSCITNNETGEKLVGICGQRIYIAVTDAREIPAAGKRLVDHLWARGHGYIKISKSGSCLRRTLFDETVWSSNHLDFAAGAVCDPPLVQQRGEPVHIPGSPVDLRHAIPEITPEVAKHAKNFHKAAQKEAAPIAEKKRQVYIKKKAETLAGPNASVSELEHARGIVQNAVSDGILGPDFRISVKINEKVSEVSVGEILEKPDLYDRASTLDPLDPEYSGGRLIGRLYLNQACPVLWSFAHGERRFRLGKQKTSVMCERGGRAQTVDGVIRIMRESGCFFKHNGSIVCIEDDVVLKIDDCHSLHAVLSRYIEFLEYKNGQSSVFEPLMDLSRAVLKMAPQKDLPRLRAVVRHPLITTTGDLLNCVGYDTDSQLYFIFCESDYSVLENPRIEDAIAAYKRIIHPFRFFPFVSPQDRTVVLSAILAVVLRPALRTCPAYAFDAPVWASGKTLLAKCIATIEDGVPKIMPHPEKCAEDEIRKRLTSVLRSGGRCPVWDNVEGVFESPSIAAFLTAAEFTDRILGTSQNVSLTNDILLIFTGNNLVFGGDLTRRILTCRIDPGMEKPQLREFEFDPEAVCRENRQQMISDALTIVQAWIKAGRPRNPGRLASFEDWDELVRQPIAWLATSLPDDITDLVNATITNSSKDPQRESVGVFLSACDTIMKNQAFTARDIYEICHAVMMNDGGQRLDPHHVLIFDVVGELAHGSDISPKTIGGLFRRVKDVIVENRSLVQDGRNSTGTKWRVVNHNQENINQTVYGVN
jgi:hypothetical protein